MSKDILIYKKTGLSDVPSDWEIKKLEDLTSKIIDGTHHTPTYTESGVPFLRVTDIKEGKIDWNNTKYISLDEHQQLIKRCKPEKGDLLLSKNGTIGVVKLVDWDEEFSIFVSLCLIKPKKELIDPNFLKHFLDSDIVHLQYKLRAKTGTVTNLHLEEIRELDIAVPSIKEQRKIAAILSSVDEAIEKTEAIIEQTERVKKGLMQQLLTKGIGHTKFKKTEIGEIPEEWEVKSISEVAKVVSGGTPSKQVSEYWENGTIPWATPTDITSNDNKYISTTELMITESGLRNSSANLLPEGSVLMTSRATIGPRCINTVPMATNQGFKSFICDPDVLHNEYLYYLIDKIKDQFIALASGSTFLEISKSAVETFKIPVPPLEEQIEMAKMLSSLDEKLSVEKVKKESLQTIKKSLMQSLLTGKVRVKVDEDEVVSS